MFPNNLSVRVTKSLLALVMLSVFNLALPAAAQQRGWVSQQPAMTYTSSANRYVTAGAPLKTYASPSVISATPVYRTQPTQGSRVASSQTCQPGLAQSKATQAAQMRLRGHLGGGLGGAKYEGVGWSNQSPQDAIENCCYWGTRPTAQIGVSKGQDGCWYACVLYH